MTNEEAVDDSPTDSPSSGPEPTAEIGATEVGQFNIKVSLNGVPLGWWTDNGSPEWWIIAVPQQSDGTAYTQISYKGDNYIKKSTNNYLSYRTGSPYAGGLKIKDWTTSAKWKLEGKNLLAVDNGKLVGRDGDSFYANGENVVEVEFVPVQ